MCIVKFGIRNRKNILKYIENGYQYFQSSDSKTLKLKKGFRKSFGELDYGIYERKEHYE